MAVRRGCMALILIFAMTIFFMQSAMAGRLAAEAAAQKLKTQEQLEQAVSQIRSVIQPTSPYTGTGKDVFLLRRHKLFYISASQNIAYTNNAFSLPNKKSDRYATTEIAFGADTIIDGTYSVRAELNYGLQRYDRHSLLDYDNPGFDASVSRAFGPVFVGLNYNFDYYAERGLDDKLLASHLVSPYASYFRPINNNLAVALTLSANVSSSSPDDFDYYSYSITLPIIYQPRPNLTLTAGVYGSRSLYDHYFQNFFTKDRKDNTFIAFASITYRPVKLPQLSLNIGYNYTHNNSTLDALDYNKNIADARAELTLRF